MAQPHVISALLDKRARKLGEIRANKFQGLRLQMELAQIDAVLRMFRSAEELATAVLVREGKEPDRRSVLMLQKSLHSSFSRQKKPVVTYCRETWPGKWRLI